MRPLYLAAFISTLLLPVSAQTKSNILFILDGSNSMWGQVDGVAKIDTARVALTNLVNTIPNETNVGLMSYGIFSKDSCDDVHIMVSTYQNDRKGIINFVNTIKPKGKTPIARSLEMAGKELRLLKEDDNHIVLISDGIESCGGDPCAVAGQLVKQGINVRIHVVGFDVDIEADKQLACIASAGGGKYFQASSTEGFKEAIAEVKKEVQVAETPSEPKEYFRDNFDGEELAEHWEVLKPNPDTFIVEDGKLLIVSGTPGSMANETVENVFKLSEPLPKGDWTITAKFSVEFQTWMERAFIGIFDNRDNYLEISLQSIVGEYGLNRYPAFDVVGVRRRKGKDKTVARRIWRGKNTGDYSNAGNFADGTKTFPQPVLLRLQKQGRSYIGGVMLEGAKEPKWLNLDKFTILRQKGKVAVGLYQTNKVKGEGTILVDWVKIETPQ